MRYQPLPLILVAENPCKKTRRLGGSFAASLSNGAGSISSLRCSALFDGQMRMTRMGGSRLALYGMSFRYSIFPEQLLIVHHDKPGS